MKKAFWGYVAAMWFAGAQAAVWPTPPQIDAKAYLLLDMKSNQVLAERDANEPVEPASLTKLMTAYLVFDALKNQQRPAY